MNNNPQSQNPFLAKGLKINLNFNDDLRRNLSVI